MADPLSMGASIVAFIEITNRIVSICKYCIETIKDAPRDFQMILGETTSLEAIIETLKASGKESLALSVTLEACRRCLSALEHLLPQPQENEGKNRRKITFAELAWPLKESKARKLLSEVSQHKATLLLAISGRMVHDIKAIRAGINNVEESLTDAERLQILRWLETTNPSTLHNQAWKKHQEETTSWLLRCPEWNDWLSWDSSKDRFIWCFGIPGCGKTVLASFVNEQLKQHCAGRKGVAHAYYYCHYTHNQDESTPFLRWTISQACRLAKWVPPQLKDLYDGGCEPNLAELNNILEIVLSRFTAFYITVDAVDESSPRSDLVALLATIALDQRFDNIRLLVTSRQYPDIEKGFSGISVPLSMSNTLVSDDIRQFIRNRLAKSRHIQSRPNLMGHIEESLATGAQGMFRWAECQIYTIERLRTESQILEALQNPPRDLAETYIRIFQQIPETDRPFVRRALIWLEGHANAPWYTSYGMKGDVLASAAAYDLFLSEPDAELSFYDFEYLRELCGCLITVSYDVSEADILLLPVIDEALKHPQSPSQYATPDSCSVPIVTFAHYSVVEFLVSPLIHKSDASDFALSKSTIAIEFMESVLRQAVSADPQGAGTNYLHDREAYCLTLAPALTHEGWKHHFELSLRFCDPRSQHYCRIAKVQKFLTALINGWGYYCIYDMPEYHLQGHPTPDTAGEASILLNILLIIPEPSTINSLLEALLRRSPDLGRLLRTRLTVTLLDYKSRLSVTGTILAILFSYTPDTVLYKIHWLVENYSRHLNPTAILMEILDFPCPHDSEEEEHVLESLVEKGADPNGPGCLLTPLKASVYCGSVRVVRLLLIAGANPNFTGNIPRETQRDDLPQWIENSTSTPLALLRLLGRKGMSQCQHPEIERLLVQYGAVECEAPQ